ncbi:competence protein CoiA family protein [Azospirillum argentinense]
MPVTSQTGWRFFRHKAAACPGQESPRHLITKTVVARAAAALGLDVTTEARLYDGAATADVLIRHRSWKVVVEVQLSRIPLAEIEGRQKRYEAAGLRCAWLVGYDVSGHRSRQDLPLFRLVCPDAAGVVPDVIIADADGHNRRVGLADFTTMLLSGQVRFREPLAHAGHPVMASRAFECWRCHREIDLLVALVNVPEHSIFSPRGILPARDLPKVPEIMAQYRTALPTLLAAAPSLTTIRPPPAGKEAGGARAHCPWCDAPISLARHSSSITHTPRWNRYWTLSGEAWSPADATAAQWICLGMPHRPDDATTLPPRAP